MLGACDGCFEAQTDARFSISTELPWLCNGGQMGIDLWLYCVQGKDLGVSMNVEHFRL